MSLKMPYCGSKKYFQKVPTTAGASIIGSRMAVLQKLCVRKRRFSSSASAKPSTSCSAIEQHQEVRRGAHVFPDRLVAEHAPVVVDAHPQRLRRSGRLARKLVNDSQIVQSSGKMLKASSSTMVGPTKSHASARSERPWRAGSVLGAGARSGAWSDADRRLRRMGGGRRLLPRPLHEHPGFHDWRPVALVLT